MGFVPSSRAHASAAERLTSTEIDKVEEGRIGKPETKMGSKARRRPIEDRIVSRCYQIRLRCGWIPCVRSMSLNVLSRVEEMYLLVQPEREVAGARQA